MREIISPRPKDPRHEDRVWLNVTRSLFATFRTRVASGADIDFDGEDERLGTWEPFCLAEELSHPLGIQRRTQYDVARSILWCAQIIARWDRPLADLSSWVEFDRITSKPNYVRERSVWAFDCIHELRSKSDSPSRVGPSTRLSVPVALSEGMFGSSGRIAWMTFEIEQVGELDASRHGSVVFQHPADMALMQYVTPDFDQSIAAAWHASCALARKDGVDLGGRAVRWRLDLSSKVETIVEGKSAGAAAAWALWHGLTARVPDPRVIVFASVTPDGELRGVAGIRVKTRAAAAVEIDTIVVVDKQDEELAHETLVDEGADTRIQVVNLARQYTHLPASSSIGALPAPPIPCA